mmetsp:Transcript_3383/g.10262  ORF Transcript_3383/g.10262 Transcript_3383/m.10262 type:complete len:232 (+) Transcript_3383:120-815(+)
MENTWLCRRWRRNTLRSSRDELGDGREARRARGGVARVAVAALDGDAGREQELVRRKPNRLGFPGPLGVRHERVELARVSRRRRERGGAVVFDERRREAARRRDLRDRVGARRVAGVGPGTRRAWGSWGASSKFGLVPRGSKFGLEIRAGARNRGNVPRSGRERPPRRLPATPAARRGRSARGTSSRRRGPTRGRPTSPAGRGSRRPCARGAWRPSAPRTSSGRRARRRRR